MKDRYKNNLFFNGKNEYSDSFQAQIFQESIFEETNLTINLFPIDFEKNVSTKEKKNIINKWVEFLPLLKNIRSLSIRYKVDQKLLNTICKLEGLENLHIWSSNVDDISEITNLSEIKRLDLEGFSKLTDISKIQNLKKLQKLSLNKCFNIENFNAIKNLNQIKALQLNGDSFAPKNLKIQNLNFIENLSELQHLDLLNTSISDKDFSPITKLQKLKRLDIETKISETTKEQILKNNKSLKSGFFTDWNFDKKEFYSGKKW